MALQLWVACILWITTCPPRIQCQTTQDTGHMDYYQIVTRTTSTTTTSTTTTTTQPPIPLSVNGSTIVLSGNGTAFLLSTNGTLSSLLSATRGNTTPPTTTTTTTTPAPPPQPPMKPVVYSKCDNSHCTAPTPNKLNVHLVPHTHDDVGWLKTVDQYYYGSNSAHQKAGVQYIIDSMVQSLLRNESRRFIYVETAFFWKWWRDQDEEHREAVRTLVNGGRLEFINGGWVMNDEATAHYSGIVDQMTWGHRRLQDNIGQCVVPRIGWQIDPFGHSREQANLFAQFGFDGLFFARLDYEDQKLRSAEKRMEFIWQASDDFGRTSDIWAHAMAGSLYGPPTGFNWDVPDGGDEPIIDDRESEDYNVDKIVDKFLNYIKPYAANYATNHLLIPMGMDFNFQSANAWFTNMDKLIKFVNARQVNGSNINVFYSTPTCYLAAVHQSNHTLTYKSDDFFPYASDAHTYWTGYFTSRPALKRYERASNNFLQVCKQLDVLALLGGQYDKEVTALREWQAVMQHHDAITGTEKQHVANNYALKLYKSIEKCQSVVEVAVRKLTLKQPALKDVTNLGELLFCQQLNVSACIHTEANHSLVVTVYNPYGQPVRHILRLPVTHRNYAVSDTQGMPVQSYAFLIPAPVLALKERALSRAVEELVFETKLPALGFATYILKYQNGSETNSTGSVATNSTSLPPVAPVSRKVDKEFSVQTKSFNVHFDGNGSLKAIQIRATGQVVDVRQDFGYYRSFVGNNYGTNRASGAYVFRPSEQEAVLFARSNIIAHIVDTPVLTEVRQKVGDWMSQTVRIDPLSDAIEFDYQCGPIPADEGKEVVIRWSTNMTTGGVFYTDSNGRQMMRRRRDYRPTYNLTVTEPVSGNYYPVTSRIAIRDDRNDLQMTVLNDRAQGGTGYREGQIEVMVHRRCLVDDGMGVVEALNEGGVDGKGLEIRGKLWLQLSNIAGAAEQHRDMAQRLYMEPVVTFRRCSSLDEYAREHRMEYSALRAPLPKNIHLMTLEQWVNTTFLLRLEHFYQWNESLSLSLPVRVELRDLFRAFVVTEALETTLSATENILAARRLYFWDANANNRNTSAVSDRFEPKRHELNGTDLSVIINPMEIRTFIIRTNPTGD